MIRQRNSRPVPLPIRRCAVLLLAIVAPALARAESPETVVRQVLMTNPVTAPYNLQTAYRNRQVVIAGVVGSKMIHDLAIRLAIGTGYPIRDDLVIDTGAAYRLAAAQAQAAAAAGLNLAAGGFPYPYPYPPPPFGFAPPFLGYPNDFRMPGAVPSGPIQGPVGLDLKEGTIEMTIDPRGVAVLRGTVPTLADRVAIGQKIAQTPGVSEVINLLQVPVANRADPENAPPADQPALAPDPKPPAVVGPAPVPDDKNDNAPQPAIVVDGGALGDRITQAFARRPALAGLPINVTFRDGVATLAGRVPTVYEAMLAFRVLEQTPGVREVIDRLEFVVPDGERQNPLIQQGRPEDVEPYLLAQIRRNVGDLAHIDRVRMLGDTLELWGSLVHAEDRPRLDAILRSIAVLRGFRLEPHITSE